MKVWIRIGFTVGVSSFAILHMVSLLLENNILLNLLSLSALISLMTGLLLLGAKKGLIANFLCSVAILFGYFNLGNEMWYNLWIGIRYMRGIILLLLIVPMISWVLSEDNYIESLIGSAKKLFKTSKRFYAGIMFLTQLISYFVLFAAIPMVYHIIQVLLKDKTNDNWNYFKSTAILRAFGLSTIWVISIPSVVLIIESTGASLIKTITQGFFISLCGILISVLFIGYHEKKVTTNFTTDIQEELLKKIPLKEEVKYKKTTNEFIFLFLSLFGPILVLNSLFNWGLLMIISICIFIWTLIYFFIKRKGANLKNNFNIYLRNGILSKTQETCILLSAGMLINIINETGLGMRLMNNIFLVSEQYSFINLLIMLPFLVILLGFLGLGPLTVMVLIGGILSGVTLPYPPELIVLSLTSGSAISVFLSPSILPMITLSNVNGLSLWKNGIKFNLVYSLAFYVFVQLYLNGILWVQNI